MPEYDSIATFYDFEHRGFDADLQFYLNVIHEEPVLEVGVGTGRILEPLARSGLEVWGIDPSPAMLDLARRRVAGLPNAHLVLGSGEELELNHRFAVAIIGLNTLWHADSIERQLMLLRSVRAHLRPRGQLLIDSSNPLTMADRDSCGERRQVFRAPYNGGSLTRITAAWDDAGAQRLHISVTYEVTAAGGELSRYESELTLRYLYRSETELLIRLAGFDVSHVYGSYDLEEFESGSPRILALARRSD